jgi:hypothetical protein
VIPGSRLRLYPGEGHISILDRPIKEIVETLLAPYPGRRRVRQRRPTARYSPECVEGEFSEIRWCQVVPRPSVRYPGTTSLFER